MERTSVRYYPPLSQLIGREALPSDVGVFGAATETVQDVLDRLLKGVRFKDLVINQSAQGDVRFYSLSIVAEEFGFNLPGTDIAFLFFPGEAGSGEANIPLAFEWRWGIKRYVHDFETAAFSRSPRAFFDLLLKVANLTEAQFIAGIAKVLLGDAGDYVTLIQSIRTLVVDYKNGTATLEDEGQQILLNVDALVAGMDALLTDLQDPAPTFDSDVDHIVETFEALSTTLDLDLDLCLLAFETVTRDLDNDDDKLDALLALFSAWFGGFGWQDLEEILIPQFSLAVAQLPVALEFPRKWLVPLDANNAPTTDEAIKSQLKFNAGAIKYSTQTGLTFTGENSFSFTKSAIGKSGLTLEIVDAKVDFSRTTNIPEADAAGYPVDFVGVYVHYVEIGLPQQWFAKYQSSPNDPVTLGIVGRDLLIGTGGFSGELGLEVLAAGGAPQPVKTDPPPQKQLEFVLGPQPASTSDARKGFKLGFSSFDMTFRQNAILKTEVKGSLTVPRFDPNPIDIKLAFTADGDFEVSASIVGGHAFRIPNVFIFKAKSLQVGKDHGRVYLSTSGDLDFSENGILKTLITKPIHLEKLTIHSDGSIEIEGGSIPLPESCALKIGPAKIAITALHLGAHEQEHAGVLRKYRYFGFDGGVSINPGGVDARGDGIKYYYSVDDLPFHSFLRIEGIGIDLVIPGSASEESAALILKGYLALKDPVYQGSISFRLPKAKIGGGAAMMYDTSYPAWIVDVNLELPKPFPLGSTSLGIYSFRGLFGLRYVAAKEAITVPAPLPEDASWGDYFRAPQDRKGVTYLKFITPDKTGGSRNPFSVGVGVGLCTETDGGKIFSSQLFLLVSLPNLIMLEGRADILSKTRVGPDDDPPYYAYLALSPESIELGAGVNYLIPKDTGAILNLNAVMEAAYFFHNAKAWYVHFGTKQKPITARIISMFDGYSYLMLSASGIEAGAGVHFDFVKNCGPVHIAAHAYLDFWAYVAFERFQAGGGVALGGYVDIKVFKFGLYIELAATLTVEVPKPFYVAGSVEVCISVNLKIKKFERCCTLEFKWEKDTSVNTSAVPVMAMPAESTAASAVHMLSGSTYPVLFSASAIEQNPPLVPLDTYIDVKFTKPVDPSAVADRILGYTSPPDGNLEVMPPRYGSRIVQHAYSLDDVKIEILDGGGAWHPYHPYKALAPDALKDAQVLAQLDGMPLGLWQKQDPGYSQIRFLALTPFSWMADMSGYVPEEMGVTPKSTYCVARAREERCGRWTQAAALSPGTDYQLDDILYRVDGDRVEALAFQHAPFGPFSLAIAPSGRASFRFLEPVVSCRLTLFTTAPSVTIHWQRRKQAPPGAWAPAEFEDVGAPTVLPRAALAGPVAYGDPGQPIEQIVIETPAPDLQGMLALQEQIVLQTEAMVRADPSNRDAIAAAIAALRKRLWALHDESCVGDVSVDELDAEIADLQAQRIALNRQLASKQKKFNTFCATDPATGFAEPVRPPPGSKALTEKDCRALAADIAALQEQVNALTGRIQVLKKQEAAAQKAQMPPGWPCGTFVNEICRLTAADYAFNQTIPGIAAIEADFTNMRAACEGAIAPIWQPRQTYRITLSVSDKVTYPAGNLVSQTPQNYFVHFRTGGPIGYFTALPSSDVLLTAPGNDDGRPEAPETALKYYFDVDKSYPDPRGKLGYAKPIYYRDVTLRLFFFYPHAYHFFADWPDVGGGARHYALELAVKDPAEAAPLPANAPSPPDHEAPLVSQALLGAQSWAADPAPRIAEEFKAMSGFQNPLSGGASNSTACLTTGGDPIVPLSKSLAVAMGDLEPDKLYTAVILNRSVDESLVAEVGRYPFRTSRYPDFATHVASLRLVDAEQNQRLAVFSFDHALAPATGEAAVLAAALAIVDRVPTTDTLAYADPFDRLLYGHLKLAPPPSAVSLEFNFMTNSMTGRTYGLWVVSPEPLADPRLPDSLMADALRLFEAGSVRGDAHVLFSKDRCQAFVMVAAGNFPIANLSLQFTNRIWNGVVYVPQTVASETFAKP
jgi:hypothetical protein